MTINGREIKSARCPCGGVPLEVDPTEREEEHYGCGKPGCCVAVIWCQGCDTRFTFALEAPEADLDRD